MTTTERRLLNFIFNYLIKNGYPPGYPDMLVHLREHDRRITTADIRHMLTELVNMGEIALPYGLNKPRALCLRWSAHTKSAAANDKRQHYEAGQPFEGTWG